MKRITIKLKLSLALILTGLTLVIAYVLVAKQVFESDKISYVFESQGSRLQSQRREMEQGFSKSLLTARSVIATFDPGSGTLNPAGQQIFQEEKSLRALELWNEQTHQALFRFEKTPGELPPPENSEESLKPESLEISTISNERFLILLRYTQGDVQMPLRLRAVVEFKNLLPTGETHQSLLLFQKGQFVSDSNGDSKLAPAFDKLTKDINQQSPDKTMMWDSGSGRYLVSVANVGVGDFKLVAVTPEEIALGALGTLFHRSLLFLVVSTFGLIAVSLTLARGLTLNLRILTEAAARIGRGDFESAPAVKSHDEMGVLSKAFSRMSKEIQRLLSETRDKARMEAELKTASLVQESLLPSIPCFSLNEIEINGMALTSTECGGDWWHYYTKGDDIYVVIADATGHGTPAALITAAARSVFSRLQEEDLSLSQIMRSWDIAIQSCSNNRVFMTGLLMKINSRTGQGLYISAGHESPYRISQTEQGYNFDLLELEVNKALGEGFSAKVCEQTFHLDSNCSLILYTDGLFSVTRPDGKTLSDLRFGKGLAAKAETTKSAQAALANVLSLFEEHRQGMPLPDDVTVVAIHRKDSNLLTAHMPHKLKA